MFGMEMNSFNVDDGFAEATCRALSKSLLRAENYEQLKSCSNITEFKLVLDETDYGKYIINPEGGPLDVNWLKRRLYQKLRDEIEYIMVQASAPLSTFLEKMMHCYQIENVVSIIMGAKHGQDPAITKSSLNPLGEFNFQGLKSVSSFGSDDMVTLFQDILIDLPVGQYFKSFIDSIISLKKSEGEAGGGGAEAITVENISEMINDNSSSDIKVFLKKIWLIQFHRWIMANCNGGTQEQMDNLLKAESDWETLQIIYNSFMRQELARDAGHSKRSKYFNYLGHLYPGRTTRLNESKEFKELVDRLDATEYKDLLDKVPDPVQQEASGPEIEQNCTIDDQQKKDLSKRYSMAFLGQFHYGVFYAFLRLKELEIANIVQLAELFTIEAFSKQHPAWKKFVPPFQYSADLVQE